MTTNTTLGLRQRPMMPARSLPSPLPGRLQRMIEQADAAAVVPLTGITTDGSPLPGLFPLERTGVATDGLVAAARSFLGTLSAEQRAAGTFPIETPQWRRWSNIHVFTMRHGLLLEGLGQAQTKAALALVQESLSAAGYALTRDVMRLNHTIGEIAGNFVEYGEWAYWLSIMGTPSADQPWGWQLDGHHVNLNCFVLGDQVVLSPAFLGSEPVMAEAGKYAGVRVFEQEERQGLELINALSGEQQGTAILYRSALFRDLPPSRYPTPDNHIEAGAFRDNFTLPYAGIRAAALSAGQQELLLSLIETYVGRMREEHAARKLAEVRRHLDETHFAWIGGTDAEAVFYYRVHSPVLLIEFDHQRGIVFDNDEPARSHIHTIVRTPNGNDYGVDLLRQHYARAHR